MEAAFLKQIMRLCRIVQKDSQKVKVKKRKKETAAEEEEKPKKEEKESRKRKVSEVAEASTVSAKRGRTTEQTPEKEEKPAQETPQPPKQGLTKTQRRNLRRKRSKLRQRENAQKEADNVSTSQQQQQQQQQSEAEPAQEQEQVNVNEPAPLNIKPLSLLSKNKNKKKNFLQFMSQKQPKHVKFSEDGETAYEVTDETYTTEAQMDGTYYNENEEQQYNDYNYYYDNSYQGAEEAQVNEYGAAFVSYHEADPSYEYNNDENSRRNGTARLYPVDKEDEGRLIYAKSSFSVTNDEKPAAEEKEQEEQPAVAAPVVQQRNYDELPKVDGFGSLVGKVDSLLAIQVNFDSIIQEWGSDADCCPSDTSTLSSRSTRDIRMEGIDCVNLAY